MELPAHRSLRTCGLGINKFTPDTCLSHFSTPQLRQFCLSYWSSTLGDAGLKTPRGELIYFKTTVCPHPTSGIDRGSLAPRFLLPPPFSFLALK